MSSCQTWATSSQFRHPWFEPASMKRKRRDTVPDIPDAPLPSSKRQRRYSNIEDGLAYLSLNGNSAPHYTNHATNSISVEEIPPEIAMDTDISATSPSQPIYTVEEPAIREINMKTSSWFEPERDRIVITDLDSFTHSDDEEEQSLTVNTALLDKIRGNVVDKSLPSTAPSTSQALVLFRPLPWTSAMHEDAKREELKKAQKAKTDSQVDVKSDEEDMAMEVEL